MRYLVHWGRALLCAVCLLGFVRSDSLARESPSDSGIYAYFPPNSVYHDVGPLTLHLSNVGIIGNPGWHDGPSASWRGGEYLYSASLWVGAIGPDNLPRVSAATEWRPSTDPVDSFYPSYEGVAGGNRPGYSPQPDDDGDGQVDEEFHNGKDDDGDGLIDEDFEAVSQQMYSCEYWDYTQAAKDAFVDHEPMNLRVRQRSFAWSAPGINEFVGFDFEVINDGIDVLRSVYLGFFVDGDAGPPDSPNYHTDDGGFFYSTDTTFVDPTIEYFCTDDDFTIKDCAERSLHIDVAYMYDVPDDGQTAEGGDVSGYFGGMFLGHTTDPTGEQAPLNVQMNTVRFFSSGNPYPEGDPATDDERYDLLGSGERPRQATAQPADYRYAFSAGPFDDFVPGERLNLQVAFVIGEGFTGMIDNAVRAQRVYNGSWRDVDGDVATGRPKLETCLVALDASTPTFWKDPCDSLNAVNILIKDTQCIPKNYFNADCDCCTPLFRNATEVETTGPETLVHWVGTVSVPSPTTNLTDPVPGQQRIESRGDRKVYLAWDNTSELVADPIQQRLLFRGYRIWRVEGWGRPTGQIGPAPNDWQLLADLSLSPPDGLGRESPYHLSKYVDTTVDSLYLQPTGSVIPGEENRWYYPVGRYRFTDDRGIKNGMKYFYAVTGYSGWFDERGDYFELEGTPSSSEDFAVVPRWDAVPEFDPGEVYVVPNPYIRGENPSGWDLIPNDSDPTGTKIAFVGLPEAPATIRIFTLAGDWVANVDHDPERGGGTAFWNMISRNGQDIASGVYIYSVEAEGKSGSGRFTIIR